MLIELWEKLRGYDKWIEAEAKIESSDLCAKPYRDRQGYEALACESKDTVTWVDRQGAQQRANFDVDDESPLYQLIGGESIPIRYNPLNPSQFYFRELLRSRVNFVVRTALTTGVMIALGYAVLGMRIYSLIKHWRD